MADEAEREVVEDDVEGQRLSHRTRPGRVDGGIGDDAEIKLSKDDADDVEGQQFVRTRINRIN